MKLAIPIFNDNVSNVFDFAHRLLLVDIEDKKETNRSEVSLQGRTPLQRADQLKALGVSVLVCGAISRHLAGMIITSGIEVLPYVTGQVDNVIGAYMNGQLARPQFCMPGCWPGARRGFGRRRRGCPWRGGRRHNMN